MDFNSAAKKEFKCLPYLDSTLGKTFDADMVSNLKKEYLLNDEYALQVLSALDARKNEEALRKLLEYMTTTYTDERLEKFRLFLGGKLPPVICRAIVKSIKGEIENSAPKVQPKAQGRQCRNMDDEGTGMVGDALPHPQQIASDSTSDSTKPFQATPNLSTHMKPENQVSPVQETKGLSPTRSGSLPSAVQRAADSSEHGQLQSNMAQAESLHQNDTSNDPDGVFDNTAEEDPSPYETRPPVCSPKDKTFAEPCTQLVVNTKEDESHGKLQRLSPSSEHNYSEPEEESQLARLAGIFKANDTCMCILYTPCVMVSG
jgi:hypothetical protein